MKAIHWFPGHMAKTRREISENLKMVDAIIELRDARIVSSSANPEIEAITKGKPRIILLNKSDLSDPKVNKQWMNKLKKSNTEVLEVNCLTGQGLKNIKPTLERILKDKHDKMKAKGMINIKTRVMVVGIPNVGKSTFINKIANAAITKTGDRPGVTKNKQWIRTKIGIELLDTPGILWPKFENEEVGLKLAFTGAIKDEIMDIEGLGYKLVEELSKIAKEDLMTRYKLTELSEDPLENLDAIGRKRGMMMSGGRIDYNRLCVMLLDEFRGGKIGKISLERPEV
ncbi:ribosome biogenesis GTPase YlqF [Clostridium bornimense]|uniref:ribosome biogenesis GTPase YlqF n=1 Tax=Clostridium bornimense TaxID=1216932 RepID=UPI001C11320F|nr:ribosome biogenesis GTPase YlqF [Clostridium bornimense]MBU5317133.1 ribosome biogenesis GTPase YlqF [Clostridium bornimense]